MWNYHINFDYCWQKKRHGKALFCKWLIFAILRSCGTNINLVLVIYVKYVYHVWSLKVKKWGKFKIVNLNILKIWNQISWRYNLQFLRYRVWQTEIGIGNYGSFFSLLPHPLKTPKNRILGGKKMLEISSFYTCVRHFGSFFALLPPNNPENQYLKKNEKIIWRCHHFALVYQKSQSYDVCFLTYGVQQTYFFVILGHFWSFTPLLTLKIIIWKKCTKCMEILSFYTCVP